MSDSQTARVLVVNPGSSSLKLDLIGAGTQAEASAELPASGWHFDEERVRDALAEFPAPDAIGYRVVHGGSRFRGAVRIDDEVLAALEGMRSLAPLHEQGALRAIRLVASLRSDVPGVACFDTAFHSTLAPAAATYALPRSWRERFGLRRYGFHGLSHAYIARRTEELLGASHRIVSCHLGSGASLAAIRDGVSVDTTMGFTPLEGLVMSTRSGSVDPGLLVWLQRERGVTVEELDRSLEHESGLLGLAGTADMREVRARVRSGDANAGLAFEVFLHRLRREIGAMAAAMNGVDVLAFTGGIGEHSSEVREGAVAGLTFLGVAIDSDANRTAAPDRDVTAAGSRVRVLVIAAREDLEIAREVRETLTA